MFSAPYTIGYRRKYKSRVLTVLKVEVIGQGQITGVQRLIFGVRLCQVQHRAIRVITSLRCLYVCNTDDSTDAVDRLLQTFNLQFINGKIISYRYTNDILESVWTWLHACVLPSQSFNEPSFMKKTNLTLVGEK